MYSFFGPSPAAHGYSHNTHPHVLQISIRRENCLFILLSLHADVENFKIHMEISSPKPMVYPNTTVLSIMGLPRSNRYSVCLCVLLINWWHLLDLHNLGTGKNDNISQTAYIVSPLQEAIPPYAVKFKNNVPIRLEWKCIFLIKWRILRDEYFLWFLLDS